MAFTTTDINADARKGPLVGRKVASSTIPSGSGNITTTIELDAVIHHIRSLVATDGSLTYTTALTNEDGNSLYSKASVNSGTENKEYPANKLKGSTDIYFPLVISGKTTITWTLSSNATANRLAQIEIVYRV